MKIINIKIPLCFVSAFKLDAQLRKFVDNVYLFLLKDNRRPS